jgi:hypothetical protein
MAMNNVLKFASIACGIIIASATARAQTLQEQATCAAQAEKTFRRDNPDQKPGGIMSYESHYNPQMDRCFILERQDGVVADKSYADLTLVDAFENHTLAWYSEDNSKAGGVCGLMPDHVTRKDCKSGEEFNAFVARYMGDVFQGAPLAAGPSTPIAEQPKSKSP